MDFSKSPGRESSYIPKPQHNLAPGEYGSPELPSTKILPTITGRPHDPEGLKTPGPNYYPPTHLSTIGPKWQTPSVKSSKTNSRKGNIPDKSNSEINSSITTNNEENKEINFDTNNGPAILIVESFNYSPSSSPTFVQKKRISTISYAVSLSSEGGECDSTGSNNGQEQTPHNRIILRGPFPRDVIEIPQQENTSIEGFVNRSVSELNFQKDSPKIGFEQNGSARKSPFISVSIEKSPLFWLTDGKLSYLGVVCGGCSFLFGIIHLCMAWTPGQCVFAGLWLMLFGVLALITEGMLLPKITIFNRFTILYSPTRLLNNRPYWIKAVIYLLVGVISIAVCAKWTSGVGGVMLLLIGIAYGLKQIDQSYKNKLMEFERLNRRPDSHVPVWTMTE